jgi:hypothetical protein
MRFIGRALGRRITKTLDEVAQTPEGRAAMDRGRRQMALAAAAQEIAGTGLEDDAARAELRTRLAEDPEAARGAIDHLGALRTSYLDDRLIDCSRPRSTTLRSGRSIPTSKSNSCRKRSWDGCP